MSPESVDQCLQLAAEFRQLAKRSQHANLPPEDRCDPCHATTIQPHHCAAPRSLLKHRWNTCMPLPSAGVSRRLQSTSYPSICWSTCYLQLPALSAGPADMQRSDECLPPQLVVHSSAMDMWTCRAKPPAGVQSGVFTRPLRRLYCRPFADKLQVTLMLFSAVNGAVDRLMASAIVQPLSGDGGVILGKTAAAGP